jgi:hypothetical protein
LSFNNKLFTEDLHPSIEVSHSDVNNPPINEALPSGNTPRPEVDESNNKNVEQHQTIPVKGGRSLIVRSDRMGCDEIDKINMDLDLKMKQADSVEAYLREAIQISFLADVEEARHMKSKGLLVKSQIPVGPSQLKIDSDVLTDTGSFGNHLIKAGELVSKSQLDIKKATGNFIPDKYPEFLTASIAEPNYLKMTSSLKVRKEKILADNKKRTEFVENLEPIKTFTKEESQKLLQLALEKRKEVSLTLNSETKVANEKTINRMQSKLDFITNPRYDDLPPASTYNNQKLLKDLSSGALATVDKLEKSEPASFVPQPAIVSTTFVHFKLLFSQIFLKAKFINFYKGGVHRL